MRLLWALSVVLCAAHAGAEDLSAQAIVDRAMQTNAFGFSNAEARLVLTLTTKGGNVRQRDMLIRAMDKGGTSKTLVRFMGPADVKGTAFLVLGNKDGDDDQYLYLPALGKAKRISGSQRQQKFMGTDLTYADLEWRDLKKAQLTRLPDATVGNTPSYVVEAVPKAADDSQYNKTITWVHKDAYVPIKVEFYDKSGRLLKTLLVKRLEKKQGKWVATETLIKNAQEGTQTQMVVQKLDSAAKFAEEMFTEQALAGG